MVLGVSFTGGSIASGSGTLVELSGDVTSECTSNMIVSGQSGVSLLVEWATSDDACDDVDADGVCDDVDDCVGQLDECGVCNGDNIT